MSIAIYALCVVLHGEGPEPLGKKATFVAQKGHRIAHRRSPRRGTRALEPVYARHWHTHEVMALEGAPPTALDRYLRCWFTGERGGVSPALVDVVVATARTFDTRYVEIVSGYRHPKYNLWLRKKGREVARDSVHTTGGAIDFTLPGRSVRGVYRHLLAHHDGGVGYYATSGFVHVDLGRKRTWSGS